MMVLLEDGIGLFNLSRPDTSNGTKISPSFWIDLKNLSTFLKCNEELVYVNFISHNALMKEIILELGTSLHTF